MTESLFETCKIGAQGLVTCEISAHTRHSQSGVLNSPLGLQVQQLLSNVDALPRTFVKRIETIYRST